MNWTALVGTFLIANAPPALAQSPTVGEMLPACEEFQNEDVAMLGAYCLGAIYGAGAILSGNCILKERGADVPEHLSIESLPSGEAALQAFTNWARQHPEAWDSPFPLGIAHALSEVWPCPEI